jgi:hypothetical protein
MRRNPIYVVSIWRYVWGERSYERISPIHVVGSSIAHARERAAQMAGSIESTRYNVSRDLRAAPYAVIETRHTESRPILSTEGFPPSHRRHRRRIIRSIKGKHEIVEPEVRIVPSVGEIGWTP